MYFTLTFFDLLLNCYILQSPTKPHQTPLLAQPLLTQPNPQPRQVQLLMKVITNENV